MTTTTRVKLIRGNRYNKWGETFERGYEYDLPVERAQALLECYDEYERPYFKQVKAEDHDDEVEVEEEITEEDGAKKRTKIRRKTAKAKKPSLRVKKSGDTTDLDADDSRTVRRRRRAEVEDEDGITV